ncbi:MAG: type II toxin-antitoxin system VapC family toxin [Granulosicoccus sp.]
MLVVDTNIIAYLFLPSDASIHSQRLLELDSDWTAPVLWRSEMRNVLLQYVRKNLLTLSESIRVQSEAEQLMLNNEFDSVSRTVIELAATSECSAYDCEFVALAVDQRIPLITADKKLVRSFPDTAHFPEMYIEKRL